MKQKLRQKLKTVQNLGPLHAIAYFLQRLRVKTFKPEGTYRLFSKHAHYPLYCRTKTSDIDVFGQIYINREYRCLDTVVDAKLIIDCGANVGYSSAYFLSRYPAARLIAIEPDPGNFAMLKQNIAPYGSRVTARRTGVWSEKSGLVISDDAWGDNREWARTVREARENESPSMIATDIGTLLQESGFDRISILKMDIEGAERQVFSSNYRHWIGKVDSLVIELHGYACREAFMRAISDQHFQIGTCDELTVCLRNGSGRAA